MLYDDSKNYRIRPIQLPRAAEDSPYAYDEMNGLAFGETAGFRYLYTGFQPVEAPF